MSFLLFSCNGNENVKVNIEVDHTIGFIQEGQSSLEGRSSDTLYRLHKKVKVHVYANRPNAMIAVQDIRPSVFYEDGYFEKKGRVYLIEYDKNEKRVIYNGGHNVLTEEKYFLYYYYAFDPYIEKEDAQIIRDYFIKKSSLTEDSRYEEGGFYQKWASVSMEQFKSDFPTYYKRYVNNNMDSLIIESRKIRKIRKNDDYKIQKFGINYDK
jgi:hypothetical protein